MSNVAQELATLSQAVDSLVDERTGVLRYVKEVRSQAGAPAFFHYAAQACNTEPLSGRPNFADSGGASTHRSVAMAKAIGEALERYCAALYRQDSHRLCSYDSAPFACVPPSEFALYTPLQYAEEEFPFVPFSGDTPIRWTEAIDICSGKRWHIPASMVYLPYSCDSAGGECKIAQSISTGLACHGSFTEAAISAICEVIERDAFTITWQTMMPAPTIRLDSLSDANLDLIKRFEAVGSAVRVLNITLDHGIPAILSILMNASEDSPAFVFSAASHLSPDTAIRKSLEELAHTRRLAVHLKRRLSTAVRLQDLHVQLYTEHSSRAHLEWLLTETTQVDCKDITDYSTGHASSDLTTLAKHIEDVGYQPLIVDLTSSDLHPLGLSVVRAVIPGFHPLFMGHHLRALGGKRLWTIPQQLGYRGISQVTGDNPWPHPFP